MSALSKLLLLLNSVSSILMAGYAYIVLWGPINLGFFTVPMLIPDHVNFARGILWIGLPAMVHVTLEAVGPLIRPPGNVFLYICSLLTSIPSICVVGFAYLLWPTGGFDPSPFQWGAMILWGPAILTEIFIAVGIGARLLQRSWFGEGGGAQTHGQ